MHRNHERPYGQCALLTEAVIEYGSHRLVAIDDCVQVLAHAKGKRNVNRYTRRLDPEMQPHAEIDAPHPRIPAIAMAITIAHGTAVAAFAASSLICTLESNALMVHTGARKLRTNAYPFVQPFTGMKEGFTGDPSSA